MVTKALRTKPVYKFYFYYKNYNFRNFKINLTFKNKKWSNFKLLTQQQPIYLCHFRKLNIKRFYYYKFNNKQFLKKYLVNYKEYNFKTHIISLNFKTIERRLDYNLYKAKFVPSLFAAHFYITNGYIFVNQKCIKNCNFILQTNDRVTIHSKIYNICKQTLINTFLTKNETLNYIKNLEIDFTTCSFIFLNNKNYNLLTLDNQLKKVDFLIKKNSTLQQNNYFKFFDHIFNYYLFYNIKINSRSLINSQQLSLIIKFLCFYFNDFFFRNILLKRVFNLKYNYLYFLTTNYNLQELQTNLELFNTQNTNFQTNNLALTFFKYNWNLIFNFYIYLLKTVQFTNIHYSEFNKSYKVQLLFNKHLFQLLKTKIKFIKYFNKLQTKSNISTYKILNYSTIIRSPTTTSIKYLSSIKYKQLLLYISSKQFKYKIYRKCTSFQQNDFKRQRLIIYCRHALRYTYFNQIKCQNNSNNATKHELYNQLILLNSISTSNLNTTLNNNYKIYYPKQSFEYYNLYQCAITSLTNLQDQFNKILNKFKHLQTKQINYKQVDDCCKNIQQQINFFNSTTYFTNLNYNKYYKSLYLLKFLLNQQNFGKLSLNLKISHSILYKLHLKYIYTRKVKILNNKTYQYSQFNSQRYKISYFYVNYNKVRFLIPTFKQKYFQSKLYLTSQIFSKYYLTHLLRTYKKNENFLNLSNKVFQSSRFLSTLKLITNNKRFNDKYFYTDLIINLTIRKLNEIYNSFYTNFNVINTNTSSFSITIKNKRQQKKSLQTNNKLFKNYTYIKSNHKKLLYCQKLYLLHIKKYIQLKNSNTIVFIKQKKIPNHIKILYTYYTTYIHKYQILKYFYNQYIWKEYSIFVDQVLLRLKLKNYDLNYIKTLYFNVLFAKFFNLPIYDSVFYTNYKYNSKLPLLINYFILIKRFYS